jgi:ribosomal protein S8
MKKERKTGGIILTYMPKVEMPRTSNSYKAKKLDVKTSKKRTKKTFKKDAVEVYDNKFQRGKQHFEKIYSENRTPDCSRGFLSGKCATVHKYAVNILCSKEYCKDCGRDGSPQHSKRFNRMKPKSDLLDQLGILVVTFPAELRYEYLNKTKLNKLRRGIKNKLKSIGYDRGLMRWHLFGDCDLCDGKGCYMCYNTGAGEVYKPHLNVIINEGFIPDWTNSYLKHELHNFLENFWMREHKQKFEINVHYEYAKTDILRVHQIKYITRSTFRIYNDEVKETLNNYRLTTTFGSWKDFNVDKLTDEQKLDHNICTHCGTKIQYQDFENKININSLTHIKNGKFTFIQQSPGNSNVHSINKKDDVFEKISSDRYSKFL